MNWLAGLVFCIAVCSTYSEEDDNYLSNYYCYLSKVFGYKWNADYSGGWCRHAPGIAKYQIQAAEECHTGFVEAARNYHYNLNKTCTEYLEEGFEGNCTSNMFTDSGPECYRDYFSEYEKSGASPFDVVAMERLLCKYFDDIMACQYAEVEQKCKEDYAVFLQVMDSYKELQHSVCAILPSAS